MDNGGGAGTEGTGGAETDGTDGIDGFCSVCLLGLDDGIGGASCGLLACGLDEGTGIVGADGGTIPDLLSCLFTDFNFGIPPAKMSPNWGTPLGGGGAGAPCDPDEDDEGAGIPMDPDDLESKMGFDLSTVVAFFNLAPFLISPSKASLPAGITEGGPGGKFDDPPSAGGGGGGGGGGPAILY